MAGAGAPAEDEMHTYDDDFNRPEQPDDFNRPKKDRYLVKNPSPTTRLANYFEDKAQTLRETYPHLPLVWSDKARVMGNIKHLREKFSTDEIESMIDAFCDGVRGGGKYPISQFPDLWVCFFTKRSIAYDDARRRGQDSAAESRSNADVLAEMQRKASAR